MIIWLGKCLYSPFLLDVSQLICPVFYFMQTKRLRKLVESVLGWTVDEDTEIDEDDEVSTCYHLFLFIEVILMQYIFVECTVCILLNVCLGICF